MVYWKQIPYQCALDGAKTGDLCVAHLTVTADGQVLFQERINLNKPAMKQALS